MRRSESRERIYGHYLNQLRSVGALWWTNDVMLQLQNGLTICTEFCIFAYMYNQVTLWSNIILNLSWVLKNSHQ